MFENRNGRNIGATVLAFLLVFSVLSIGLLNGPIPFQNASAAVQTIQASKTTFFGSNVVEVTITDENLKDNNDGTEQDELAVSFDVRSGSDSIIDSVAIGDDAGDISAEIGDSGKFVFYLTGDLNVTIADLDDPEFGSDSQIVYVTEGGDIDIGIDANNDAFGGASDGISLNEGATITVTFGDASIDLTYEDAKGDVTLDRTTVGSDGFVYLKITDQDANNDPTARDQLNFDNTIGNLTMTYTGVVDNNLGQAIVDAGIEFLEGSDNSGIFEVRLSVADIFGIDESITPKSVKIELQDFQIYPNDPFYGADETGIAGDDDTSESVTVDNGDGLLQEVTNPASPRSELVVKVVDPDRNLDSKVKDRIPKAIAADLSSGGTGDDEPIKDTPVDLVETGINTGLFVPDLANSVFKVTIGTPHVHDGIVQIENAAAAKSDLLVRYADFTPDKSSDITTDIDNGETGGDAAADAKIILFKGKASANTAAQVSLGQSKIGAQDKVFLVVTDPDLNDDKNGVDSFDLTIPSATFANGKLTVTAIQLNSIDIADLKLDSIINGEEADGAYPANTILVSFQETGKDTSVFEAEFDYKLIAPTNSTENGDNTEFIWIDQLLDSPLESSARLTINEATKGVAWQQNEYAIPFVQEGRGSDYNSDDFDSKRTRIKLLITDPSLNKDSSSVEQKAFSLFDDSGDIDASATGFPDLTVKLVGVDGKTLLDAIAGKINDCGGLSSPTTFTETGANTGIFDKTFDFLPQFAGDNDCAFDPEDLANAKLVAKYDDSTASTLIKGYNGILTTSSRTITSGQEITITVTDPDQNHDRDVREQVEISIDPDGLEMTTQLLDENDLNTGVFTKKLVVGEDFEILDGEQLVDEVKLTYSDSVTSNGASEERELKLIPPSSNAKLSMNPEGNIGPSTKITLTLIDADLNKDPNAKDIINTDVLKIRTDNKDISDDKIAIGEDGLELEETSNNSGEFKLVITLVPITHQQKNNDEIIAFLASGHDLDFPAEPMDTIAISYIDENHDKGSSDVVNVLIKVQAFDPIISTDKEAYLPGEVMTITIEDPDANRDPDVIDTIEEIRVLTLEDMVGESFGATETGANTGIFTLQVPIVDEPESDAIAAQIGEQITIRYTDDFPADYDPDKGDEKDFDHTVKVGKVTKEGITEITNVETPTIVDLEGNKLDILSRDRQVILSTTITNNLDSNQPYVAIIEVRTSDGITEYLSWQTGELGPDDIIDVGQSWLPDSAGSYTVRTFVISDLSNPQILSSVHQSEISVS